MNSGTREDEEADAHSRGKSWKTTAKAPPELPWLHHRPPVLCTITQHEKEHQVSSSVATRVRRSILEGLPGTKCRNLDYRFELISVFERGIEREEGDSRAYCTFV